VRGACDPFRFLGFPGPAEAAERFGGSIRGVCLADRCRGFPGGSGGGAAAFGRLEEWPPDIRSRHDVQDPGDSASAQSHGRTGGVFDHGTTVLHAVLGVGLERPGAGCTDDLAFPGAVDPGRVIADLFTRFDGLF